MTRVLSVIGVALASTLSAVPAAVAAENAETAPTFAKNVAPILYENCVICHRPGQVAPMSLLTYQDARPWGRAIKEKVVSREMPPWYADRRFGTFRNERGLTQEQIDTIVAWVDGGAPKGEDAEMPAPPQFAEGWSHPSGAAPDMVLDQPVEWVIAAEGELPNFSLWGEVPFEKDTFLEAIQLKPTNYAVVHHSGVYTRNLPRGTKIGTGPAWPGGPVAANAVPVRTDGTVGDNRDVENIEDARVGRAQAQAAEQDVFAVDGTDKMVSYVPGRGFEQFWAGVGKRMRADRYLSWGTHYQATGKEERDRSQLGLWLQKVQAHHEVLTRRVGETHVVEGEELVAEGGRASIPVIPPNAGDWAITGITAFGDDVTLYAMSPHMHLRGKDLTYVLTLPDGTEEILLSVPKYDFNWQLHYELSEPKNIPAGSTIKSVGHFDNSVKNRYNPAPQKEVYWAEQSWDEMYNGFMEYSIDKLDLSKEKPSTEE